MNESNRGAAGGQDGRPILDSIHTYDVDTAQHFLAGHANVLIVAFDHDAMAPDVTIYTTTPEGVLSPGDYYLWPLLHDTSERLQLEIEELAQAQGRHSWHYDFRRLRKWQRRIPLLTTLIRIRKATIQALCTWDLTHTRPDSLTVINTRRDLTGLTVDEAVNTAAGISLPAGISSPTATIPL